MQKERLPACELKLGQLLIISGSVTLSSVVNEELIRQKWQIILNHIWGIHSWKNNLFHKCGLAEPDQKQKSRKIDSASFIAMKNVVKQADFQ